MFREELIDLIKQEAGSSYTWAPYEDNLPDGVKWIDEEELSEGRWHMIMLTIVEFKGKLFGIEWGRGLTEYQENEFYADKSTVYPVARVAKTVYTYKRVK